MGDTKFTPGPWQYRPHEFDDWGTVRGPNGPDGYGNYICQAKDIRYMDDDYLTKCRSSKIDPWSANAHLIAAAPELYEALEITLDAIGALSKPHDLYGYGLTESEVSSIFSALAKARGES